MAYGDPRSDSEHIHSHKREEKRKGDDERTVTANVMNPAKAISYRTPRFIVLSVNKRCRNPTLISTSRISKTEVWPDCRLSIVA